MKTSADSGHAPHLSILLITWNGWTDTRRCLASIHASAYDDYEIIVFDNASTDGTADSIEREFPAVRVVRSDTNVGHTVGFNRLMRIARGEFVLLLDSDTEVEANAIGVIVQFLRGRSEVGLVAPRTLNSDGSVQPSARNFPSPLSGLFGRQSALTRWFPQNPISRRYLMTDRIADGAPYEVQQISSACMLLRRALFDDVGPWDEGYPGYWVDTDWCYRTRMHRWKVYCVPEARIVHHEQNRRGKRKSLRRIWMFHYGAYRFYRNNMTWGTFDPRAITAAVALTAHAGVQLLQNVALTPEKAKAATERREGSGVWKTLR